MGWKCNAFLLVILAVTISARPRKIVRQPCGLPPKQACFSTLATPYPAVIETIDYACRCQEPICNDQLILPPCTPELPCGLGYFSAALPLVAKYYEPAIEYMTTGAYLPVTSDCGCLTLAAPICPDWAPLVRPIIL